MSYLVFEQHGRRMELNLNEPIRVRFGERPFGEGVEWREAYVKAGVHEIDYVMVPGEGMAQEAEPNGLQTLQITIGGPARHVK